MFPNLPRAVFNWNFLPQKSFKRAPLTISVKVEADWLNCCSMLICIQATRFVFVCSDRKCWASDDKCIHYRTDLRTFCITWGDLLYARRRNLKESPSNEHISLHISVMYSFMLQTCRMYLLHPRLNYFKKGKALSLTLTDMTILNNGNTNRSG